MRGFAAGVLLLAAACPAEPRRGSPPPPPERTQPAHEVTKPMQGRLAQLQALLGTDQQAFIDRFGIRPEHVRDAAVYQRMKDVTEIHHPDQPDLGAARCFFRNGKLVLIYTSGVTGISQDELDTLRGGESGEQAVLLRSRAGKTSNLHVHAGKGVAFSKGKRLEFIELFPPMTQQEYEQTIYVAPGAFTL